MANEFSYFEDSPFFDPSSSPNFPVVPSNEFFDRFLWDIVNEKELIKDIAEAYTYNQTYLNYHFEKYYQPGKIAKPTMLPPGMEGARSMHPYAILERFRVQVSTKSAKIETKPFVQVVPNAGSRYAEYRIFFLYEEHVEMDDEDISMEVELSSDATTGEVGEYEKRLKAIQLKTHSHTYFKELLTEKFNYSEKEVQSRVKLGFDWAFKHVGKNDFLGKRNLYWQAPKSYLKEFNIDKLYTDLLGIVILDLSWWEEANGTILKLLELIAGKEKGLEFLYEKFNKNPIIIKGIYDGLDGISQRTRVRYDVDGKALRTKSEYPNKTILASLVLALCSYRNQGLIDERDKTLDVIFRIDDTHRVDGNVKSEDQTSEVFNLTQERFKRTTFINSKGELEYNKGWYSEGETKYLHPLDMVTLVTRDENSQEIRLQVPAIFVKDIAYHEEWKRISKAIRVGVDILIIIVSAATLVGGAGPFFTTLAIVDTVGAGSDLLITTFEKEIRSIKPGGAEFLDLWEKVYFVQGIATGVAILPNLIRSGSRVLLKMSSSSSFDQVMAMVKYAVGKVKGFPSFVSEQFEIVVNAFKEFKSYSSPLLEELKLLQEEGLLIVKGEVEGAKRTEYFLYYGDELIGFGRSRDVFEQVSNIIKTKGKTLKDQLLNLLKFRRSNQTMVYTSAKIGEEATNDTIKWGTVKMKQHPDYQSKLEFLEQRNIEIREISDISEDVGYTETRVYDSSGKYLRTEKLLEVHPEMRFLDLEHEIDHVIQFEVNLEGKYGTVLKRELSGNRSKFFEDRSRGWTSKIQKAFLEYDVRINEFNRLSSREAPESILSEHFTGVQKYKEEYERLFVNVKGSKRKQFFDWKRQHFPNFDETLNQQ